MLCLRYEIYIHITNTAFAVRLKTRDGQPSDVCAYMHIPLLNEMNAQGVLLCLIIPRQVYSH